MQKQMFTVEGEPATFENVFKAAIRFGAVEISSDQDIDDYAKILYCPIYERYHSNEFDWRRVRVAMRKKIEVDKQNYPNVLYLEKNENFLDYDFSSGMLPLAPSSVVKTRRLALTDVLTPHYCDEAIQLPTRFIAELTEPMRLDGVELTEDEARTVVSGLAAIKGSSPPVRRAYGRYTIMLTAGVPAQGPERPAHFIATLQNVTLYEDQDYLRPFWSGQSSFRVNRQQQGELDQLKFQGIDPTDTSNEKTDKLVPTIGPSTK